MPATSASRAGLSFRPAEDLVQLGHGGGRLRFGRVTPGRVPLNDGHQLRVTMRSPSAGGRSYACTYRRLPSGRWPNTGSTVAGTPGSAGPPSGWRPCQACLHPPVTVFSAVKYSDLRSPGCSLKIHPLPRLSPSASSAPPRMFSAGGPGRGVRCRDGAIFPVLVFLSASAETAGSWPAGRRAPGR